MSSPVNIFSSNIEVISAQAEFGASTITLVDPPPAITYPVYPEPANATPPLTPTPEDTHTPARPRLTIAPDSETEEGEIIDRVHRHNYPLSPQSSLNVMQGHPELDAGTLRTIAIGLANTAIGRTFQHLKAKTEIEQLRKELTNLRAEMSRQPDAECPEGFEENHGRLPDFVIPDADNVMRQARYIKLGNGPVPFALGTLGQEAEVARYHEADTRILNIAAEIHALDCELQIAKAETRQSRGRLEGARAQQRLRALQALDTHRPARANAHAAGLRFARGRATFLDGE